MKKIGLGIALILFGILLTVSLNGLATAALLCGAVGLGCAVWGCLETPKNE